MDIITDIGMAFVAALSLEMISTVSKYLKQLVVLTCCLTCIIIYFVNGCTIDFIGFLDLSIWVMFIIVFDIPLMIINEKIKK